MAIYGLLLLLLVRIALGNLVFSLPPSSKQLPRQRAGRPGNILFRPAPVRTPAVLVPKSSAAQMISFARCLAMSRNASSRGVFLPRHNAPIRAGGKSFNPNFEIENRRGVCLGSIRLRRVFFGVPPKIRPAKFLLTPQIYIGALKVQAERLNSHAGGGRSQSHFGTEV